jgi:hypothetical protein
MRQPRGLQGTHETLKWHLFCGDLFFCVHVFTGESIEVSAAWVYDGGVREIFRQENTLQQSAADYLDISSRALQIVDVDGGVSIVCRDESGDVAFSMELKERNVFAWKDPADPENEGVIHWPDMSGTATYNGKTYSGHGYCKRVMWAESPRYWGYRFLQSTKPDGSLALWGADGVFGFSKYDYFRLVRPDGTLLSADPEMSSHKQNTFYAKAGDTNYRIAFEELGYWETRLVSKSMDSMLRQQYGRMTLFENEKEVTSGPAFREYCYGTLG